MAITVKHTKVSTIPDGDDTSVVRPSDWNADHQLTGTIPVDNGGTGASTLTGYVKGNGTSTMTANATIPNTDVTGLGTMSTQNSNNISVTGGSISGTTVSGYIPTTEKAAALGVATLDAGGTVPLSQIPASIQGGVSYQGTWNASTNTPTLTNGVGTKGYYYVVSVAGSTNLDGITSWNVGDWAIFNGTVWQKVDNTDAVTSVNGYTGTVVLTAADVSAVPYTGATTAVDLNNKSLTNVSNLGVGTSTVPTIKIRAVGDNNSSSRIAMRGYSSDANSSAIRVTKFRGTVAAPQAPQSGDSLGKFELAGYGTTSSEGYPQASLEGLATEAWGATARGTKAVIKVTPNTTTTQVTAVTINQDSTAVFANTVTANGVLLTGNTGTVTSVAATAGTGITVSGSPITTSGTLTITNSAPDQTVVLTAGTGISTSGTYPNFTITNTSPSSGGTVTSVSGTAGRITSTGGNTPIIDLASGVATAGTTGSSTLIPVVTIDTYGRVTGITTASNPQGTVTSVTGTAPVVSSGGATPAISMAAATGSVNGYLTSTDWTTFNNKGSGTVTSVAASVPSFLSIAGSPITSSGTLDFTYSGTALPVVNGGTGQTSYTNGQLLIGNTTGNTLTKATLTAGAGIAITNAAGSITIANSQATYSVSYLVVAGGSAGGYYYGGGGGAGGFISSSATLSYGTTYTVTIGAGGTFNTTGHGAGGNGNNGSNSVFGSFATAIGGGGGGGGSNAAYSGNAGGSGGGGGGSGTASGGAGTSGQGNAGGASAALLTGAGGGAGAVGGAGGGNGGVGLTTTLITTTQATTYAVGQVSGGSVYFAGGGGSSAGTGGLGGGTAGTSGGASPANTGGGSGGDSFGAGGSGVVILSILTSNYSGVTTGSPTVVTNGANTVLIFTSSGSYTG
jgi:hypothetical protein